MRSLMTNPLRASAILALSLAAIVFTSSPARATIEIAYQIDNTGPVTLLAVSPTNAVTYSGNIGGLFNVAFTIGTSNSPGGAMAFDTQGNNVLTTLYATGSHTLNLYVSADGFTSPSGATTLTNTSAITELMGSTNVTFTSYATAGSSLLSTAGPSTSVSYSVSGISQSNGANSSINLTLGSPYTLTTKGDYTLTAGTNITIVGGNATVTPAAVPEPATTAMALSALPLLALAYRRHRRRESA